MQRYLQIALLLFVTTSLTANMIHPVDSKPGSGDGSAPLEDQDLSNGQAKLLHISATIDGSDRLIFTGETVRFEHKFWQMPANVMFDGKPWNDLAHTPQGWSSIAGHLELTEAHIVSRKGRDVIALEQTAHGFVLYLDDSPNGAADYEVTISIPQWSD